MNPLVSGARNEGRQNSLLHRIYWFTRLFYTHTLTVYFCKSIRALTMFPRTLWLLLCLLDAITKVIGLWCCRRAYDVTAAAFVAFFLSSFSELSASKNDMPARRYKELLLLLSSQCCGERGLFNTVKCPAVLKKNI